MNLSRFPRIQFAHLPTPLEFLPRLTAELGGPQIYVKRDDLLGLAAGGKDGLFHLLRLMEAEIRTSMALLGLHNFDEIDSSFVEQAEPVIDPHQLSPYVHLELEELEYDR